MIWKPLVRDSRQTLIHRQLSLQRTMPRVAAKAKAASSSGDPEISEEVLRMLEQLRIQDETVTIKNVDEMGDSPVDLQGNPIFPHTFMYTGKYKTIMPKKTYWQIYKEDKKYVQWVRVYIPEKSHEEMQRLKIFISFVDQNKIKRCNEMQDVSRQIAEAKSKAKAKAVAKGYPKAAAEVRQPGKTRNRDEDDDMEWDKVDEPAVQHWEQMTIGVIEHQAAKKQAMVEKLANHPNALQMLAHGME